MKSTLIFDLGNVLFFFNDSKMVRQLAAALGCEAKAVQAFLFDEERLHGFERGEISSLEMLDALKSACNSNCNDEKLLHAGSDIFTPNEPLIAALPRFKERGYRLIALSNTVEMHIDFLSRHYSAALDHFDERIYSYRVGLRKPEPGIYALALAAAGCPKENTLFIDDMEVNIAAAKALGIPSHHFVNTQHFLKQTKAHV